MYPSPALSSYSSLAPRDVGIGCSMAPTPYACLDQFNALAFEFGRIIEDVQYTRNVSVQGRRFIMAT